jgi:hypothetical protein
MAGIEPAYDSLDANGPPGVRAVTVYVSLVREVSLPEERFPLDSKRDRQVRLALLA